MRYAVAGPWDNEPDEKTFVHNGMNCLIRRSDLGTFCGYVFVPTEHPFYEKEYDDLYLTVHGGITFAGHFPCLGYAFGFDCSHSGDLVPGFGAFFIDAYYRTIEYVEAQCKNLADQLVLANGSTVNTSSGRPPTTPS